MVELYIFQFQWDVREVSCELWYTNMRNGIIITRWKPSELKDSGMTYVKWESSWNSIQIMKARRQGAQLGRQALQEPVSRSDRGTRAGALAVKARAPSRGTPDPRRPQAPADSRGQGHCGWGDHGATGTHPAQVHPPPQEQGATLPCTPPAQRDLHRAATTLQPKVLRCELRSTRRRLRRDVYFSNSRLTCPWNVSCAQGHRDAQGGGLGAGATSSRPGPACRNHGTLPYPACSSVQAGCRLHQAPARREHATASDCNAATSQQRRDAYIRTSNVAPRPGSDTPSAATVHQQGALHKKANDIHS